MEHIFFGPHEAEKKTSFTKLHVLFFVPYKLKLQIQQLQAHQLENKPTDPVGAMIDAVLFDHSNPITEWSNKSMAESDPLLDDKYGQPSRKLCRLVHESNLGKRKRNDGAKVKVGRGKESLEKMNLMKTRVRLTMRISTLKRGRVTATIVSMMEVTLMVNN